MSTPILKTKLYIPRVPSGLVSRPRLVERLRAGGSRKLILLSASAGFGKTTVLSEWATATDRAVAWVSLDDRDNDPGRFWTHVVAALQTVQSGLGPDVIQSEQLPEPPVIEELLVQLINSLSEMPVPVSLVLDDLHFVSAPEVHDALTFLLDNLPPQVQLIVSSRADPPWMLARLRARREMAELRTEDLRFTPGEVADFVERTIELDFSATDTAALYARTEGWIVGLQLAALSMQGRREASSFLTAFSGSHRFILDYLVEEALDRQPGDVQEFLLRTSVLERMTAPLCDAVTGRDDSRAILVALEQANLFLVPLDEERRWYRYHHLFGDLLRGRMSQVDPELAVELNLRASRWYEGRGLLADAVSYALSGGDVERVATLVAGNALAIMGHGELQALVRWLDGLPDELVLSKPWLCVADAWVLVYAGQLGAAEQRLVDVEAVSEGCEPSPEGVERRGVGDPLDGREQDRHIAGHASAIQAYMAGLRGEMEDAVSLSQRALACLPESDLMARGFATSLLGSTLRWQGDLESAAQASLEAVAISRASGVNRVAADTFCDLAALQIVRGQLREAADTCKDALSLADQVVRRGGRRLPVTGFAHARMSAVLREWNSVDLALEHAQRGIDMCRQWGWADGLVFGYEYLAQALLATGNAEGALETIRDGQQLAQSVSPWLGQHMASQEAGMRLAQGNLAAAQRWVTESGLGADDEARFSEVSTYLVLARVLLSGGRQRGRVVADSRSSLQSALRLLRRLLSLSQAAGATGYTIEILVLQSLVHEALDQAREALVSLSRALDLAEPQGYVRVFVSEGAPMDALLREAISRGGATAYAEMLLGVLEGEGSAEMNVPPEPSAVLFEPLSERELEVLRLLSTSVSTSDIADSLVISMNTLRTHTKNVYGKLGVHSRMEAVERAEELRLL